jgi:Transposase.
MTQSSISLEEKIQKSPSADKVIITVLWDCEGVIVVDAMPRGETVKSGAYIRTLTEHGKHFRRVSNRNQHDIARPHTSWMTWGVYHKIWLDSVNPFNLQS